jgi:hypothetical protein
MVKETSVSDTEGSGLPPELRFLKTLVTVLTAVMIGGVVAIVALLVIRLPDGAVALPEELAVPAGVEVRAVTQAPSYWLVTTEDDRLLVFAPDGALTREIALGE